VVSQVKLNPEIQDAIFTVVRLNGAIQVNELHDIFRKTSPKRFLAYLVRMKRKRILDYAIHYKKSNRKGLRFLSGTVWHSNLKITEHRLNLQGKERS